ncbi:ABC transporter ATP-binding protein [Natranaeroarchaeum sulfidigenes]|uniref:Molybdate/tungstate import ATP-binding protein WtpC n=1 Tax=Natranaeroarchaeum sulfidigenes TaxID=2784880 RepID=A0A897N029_9EURY|nr:ABC transporter ATP-binding protein [Natranaeroarchaeum sulfidigenes]QSG03995.1 ABC-type spermidine/putrescine transport system,ATPase component [Natranaeroarchaeum sulfidigenes]
MSVNTQSEEVVGELSGTRQRPANQSTTSETHSDSRILALDGASKHYGHEAAVDELSLSVQDGEFVTLLGPSGCGKSTTLRLIAGLERPDTGRVRIEGETVAAADDGTFVRPEHRDVGVVFQDFALFPHMTAAENVAFGIDDLPDAEREARVDELLELVGLSTHCECRPEELSGGQQQRVALARALAPEPEILLLDEPFSNLDVDLRVEMREEVRRIVKETGVTAVSVTHDQEEALSISDRVAVMHDGKIEQVGPPEEVFQRPTSRFVATFLGHASFLPGYVQGDEIETSVDTLPREQVHGLQSQYDHTELDVLVRPDDVLASCNCDGDADGEITYRRYLGPTVLYRVELDSGETLQCMHNHSEKLELGMRVDVSLVADHELVWFPIEDDSGS